jgi:hypothetical protein
MTVSSTINREQYATDGVTTAFTVHFPFFNDTDVNAIVVSGAGVETVLALNTDFSVTGGSGAGGTLICNIAPASGGTLTLYREIPFTQEDDYVEDDPLPADTLEGGFDRAAMRDQQLLDAVNRALIAPVTVPAGFSGVLPTPQADFLIGWNGTGTAMENKNPVALGVAVLADEDTAMAATSAVSVTTPLSLARAIRAAKLSAFTLSR